MTKRPRRPDNLRLVSSAVIFVTGLIWIGQGLGYLEGDSFMVGDPVWAMIGSAMLGLAAFLVWQELERRRGR